MQRIILIATWLCLCWVTSSHAAILYVDATAGACAGTYSVSSRACTGSDTSYATIAAGLAAVSAGDTLYLRAGTFTTNFQMGTKTGTASAELTIAGYPGETVTIQPTGNTYFITYTDGLSYVTFRNLVFDGVNLNLGYGLKFNQGADATSGQSNLTFDGNDITNGHYMGFQINGNNHIIRNNKIHDATTDCVPGRRYLGIYHKTGANIRIENNDIYNMPGGGMQIYDGLPVAITNPVIRYNDIHENDWCGNSGIGGILVGGNVQSAQIYGNRIVSNGSSSPNTVGSGIFVGTYSGQSPSNTLIQNNTVLLNTNYGIRAIAVGLTGTRIENNIVLGNLVGQISTIWTTNTNYTTGVVTDCLVSSADIQLIQGTNPCRDTGTSVSTRPSPVGTPDIGAHEQGIVASAVALSGGGLEATISVMTPGVLPTSSVTGFSVTCVGCTGTPAVGTVALKAGSNNVLILPLTGLSASGTCTLTLGSTNATDSLLIGTDTDGLAQGLNSVTALAVSGTCANTGSGSAPTDMIAHYNFNASDANDQTVNNNDGVVSSGITFASGFQSLAAVIPADSTYRHIAYPTGASTNLGTTSVTWCGVVTPDTTYSQKIVFSPGGNGTNQRFYVGWATVSGQQQWGIGVGSSSFATGSEFPVHARETLVCLINDAATDTVTLWIDRVEGTSAGSVKTHAGHTTIATNFRIGNDGTNTINNGGFTIDEPRLWDRALSDAEVEALYDDLFGASAGLSGYTQSHVQYEGVYLLNGAPEVRAGVGTGKPVVANGTVAITIQITCTGAACATISVAPYYSTDGVTYNLRIPASMGADNIWMWGSDVHPNLNSGATTGCVNATGLTANDGSTVLTAVTSPTFTLAQDHCIAYRLIVHVGNIAGQSRYIQFKQDNGQDLVGGYTATARLDVIASQANSAP